VEGWCPDVQSCALGAETFVFVTDQAGDLGLMTFRRNSDGSLMLVCRLVYLGLMGLG
jgi:hypothetical protein